MAQSKQINKEKFGIIVKKVLDIVLKTKYNNNIIKKEREKI